MATSIGKLNVTNIKSPLGGGRTPIHKLNFTSGLKVGSNKFAGTPAQLGDVAKSNISRIDDIISLEDRAKLSEQKISSLTRILALQKKNKNKERDQLTEINDSLKDIGNALALDFANRITEEKQELNLGKDQIRKDKLSFKEKLLETGKRMGETIKKTTASITAPALGIFGRIFEFLKTVFTGALIGKSLDWLEQDGSVEKLKTFFDRIKENLPTFGRILGAVGIVAMLTKVVGLMTTMTLAAKGLKAGLLLFANPLTWKILAAVALGALIWRGGKWLIDEHRGGPVFDEGRENIRKALGIGTDTDKLVRSEKYGYMGIVDSDAGTLFGMTASGEQFRIYGSQYRSKQNITVDNAEQSVFTKIKVDGIGELSGAEGWDYKYPEHYKLFMKRKGLLQELEKLKDEYKKEKNFIRKDVENIINLLRDVREANMASAVAEDRKMPLNQRKYVNVNSYKAETEALVSAEYDKRAKRLEKLANAYRIKLKQLETRRSGGAFSGGKTYLVGEDGPELARFNGSGTIERNGRTAQLLSNKFGSGVNIVPFDLPTIKASAPKLSSNTKATVVNDIVTYSSVNIANPYMVEVPEIFGITV